MADESVDTAPTGLPSSVEESNPDFGELFKGDENQSIMEKVENEILYATPEDDASEPDAVDDTSTPEEVAAPEGESDSTEETKEEPAEEEAPPEPDDKEEEEPEPETPEEKLARLEKENAELQKRVSGASRKATFENDKVAQLEAQLQRLTADKQEAERRASLKPYHLDHPEHEAYQQKKQRVADWMRVRGGADTDEERERIDRSYAAIGLTQDDIQLVTEGRAYEQSPQYQERLAEAAFERMWNKKAQEQRYLAEAEALFNDPENQRLMKDAFPQEFDTLWNQGHPASYVFEHLRRLDAEAKLKEATAAKNRVEASKQVKSNLSKKKAAVSAETKPAPKAGPLWAAELADKAVEEYEKQTGRSFVPDRRDCQEFFNEFCRGKEINTNERE